MQVLTLSTDVRFRAAQGDAIFFNPFRGEMVDNGMHASEGKGSWVTLDAGTQVSIVGAYPEADTFMLIVDETGQGMDHENSYGMVVRGLSMEKILTEAFEAEVAAEVVAA